MPADLTTNEIDELCFTPAVELSGALQRRELSSLELTEALLDRIARVNPTINAFVTLLAERVIEEADACDRERLRRPDEVGPLFGLPVTVKDLTSTAGVRTTFGHPAFKDHIPDHDDLIWARLKQAGAVLLGKTATPPFGMNSVTESELHGVTNNPWDPDRTVGGSSGGAAAAVAAGMGPLATGSDGGGSIRVPSALCGVVGLKASRGRIPIGGEEGSRLEQVTVVGPITRTVRDTALMLNVIAGPDPFEMFALQETGVDYLAALDGASVAGLRVAYSPDLGAPPLEQEVRDVVSEAVSAFADDLGAHVDEILIDLPDPLQYFGDWWGPQAMLADEDLAATGASYATGPAVETGLERAKTMTAVDYARVQFHTREAIHRAFATIFLDHDLLVWPTTPMVAFPHPGEKGGPTRVAGTEVRFPPLQNQRYTEAISHAGYPAITVPAGWTQAGLPVGLQIAGHHAADAAVLIAAAAFEQARPWSTRRPALRRS